MNDNITYIYQNKRRRKQRRVTEGNLSLFTSSIESLKMLLFQPHLPAEVVRSILGHTHRDAPDQKKEEIS